MKIAVLADVHSNWPALEAALAETDAYCDEYWFLGDMTGFGPHPCECLQRMRKLEQSQRLCWRAGNHDLAMCDNGPDGLSLTLLGPEAEKTGNINLDQLRGKPSLLRWYRAHCRLEHAEPLEREVGTGFYVAVHASLQDLFWIGWPIHPDYRQSLLREVDRMHSRAAKRGPVHGRVVCLFCGHTHQPGYAWSGDEDGQVKDICFHMDSLFRSGAEVPLVPGISIVHPGSVGQPRDGDPRASYVLLDTDRQVVRLRRVEYPVENTVRGMQEANFPEDLRERLGPWLRLGGPGT